MSTRKATFFYMALVAVASIAVGMVIASRLDLSPASSAQVTVRPAVNNDPIGGPIDALTFRRIAEQEIPAVVNIRTIARVRGPVSQMVPDDLFRRFFGPTPRPEQEGELPERQGTGTGFVIDARKGYILTNNHVVEDATSILVTPYGAARTEAYDAELVGRDILTDTALLRLKKLPSRPLAQVRFGNSDEMRPGDWVMAIGNPFGLEHTVTVGVISAKARPLGGVPGRPQNMLQTDAAINPGNSGGPLLNIRGEVIGINTSIISSDERQGNMGIGFAMPINTVLDVLPQLRQGKVQRGVIGIQVNTDPITPQAAEALGLRTPAGAVVTTVTEGGPADRGGMKPGDVIVEYNGKPVRDSSELVDLVVHTKPGTTVPIVVVRKGERQTLRVTVDELDLEAEAGGRAPRRRESEEPTSAGLGMELSPLTPEMARRLDVPPGQGGAVVRSVERRSPAANGNVQPGDVILEVNRRPVSSPSQVAREVERVPSGGVVTLLVWRNGQEWFLTVTKP